MAVRCTPSLFSGPWKAIALPVADFLQSRNEPQYRAFQGNWIPYGPAHLMPVAWAYGIFDYLKEPWTVNELILRATRSRKEILTWESHGLAFELSPDAIRQNSKSIELTWSEFIVLRTLALRSKVPVSRELLLLELKGTSEKPASRIVDTIVKQVRAKLREVTGHLIENPIVNVRGHGYFLS